MLHVFNICWESGWIAGYECGLEDKERYLDWWGIIETGEFPDQVQLDVDWRVEEVEIYE